MIMNNELDNKGYTILRGIVSEEWLNTLSEAVDKAFLEHQNVQSYNGNEIKGYGVALHVLLSNNVFIEFLQELISNGFINEIRNIFFDGHPCILNSFSALDNVPNTPNFSAVIHRDLRFYSGVFPMMLNCLVMVDDFTEENGGTYLFTGSHMSERKPTDEEFYKKAIQATGKRGDILIFNANVWHSSAPNKTEGHRRAIPITISRTFMKQLLDYPRALGNNKEFTPELRQLLGYDSRVPASLDEWYQPEDKRYYKKGQE